MFSFLAPDGLLVFTANGRAAHEVFGTPIPGEEGYFFSTNSEQKNLPGTDYGTMVVTPGYVFDAMKIPNAQPVLFHEAFWWDYQDTYIVRNAGST